MGIGLIDIDKCDCMMLKAVQSPDTLTLVNWDVTLNDWYLKVIEQIKEQLLSVSKYIVADAYFSKHAFNQGLQDLGSHLVSRLRDDSSLLYLYQGEKTGKKGQPKTFDGKIDVSNLDDSRVEKLDIYEEEGKLYTLIAPSEALKRNIRLVIYHSQRSVQALFFHGYRNEWEGCNPILQNKVSDRILL